MKKNIFKFIIIVFILLSCILLYYLFFRGKEKEVINYDPLYSIQDNIITQAELKNLTNDIPFIPYVTNLIDAYNGGRIQNSDVVGLITLRLLKNEPIEDASNEILNSLNLQYNFMHETSYSYSLYKSEYLDQIFLKYHLPLEYLNAQFSMLSDIKINRLDNDYTVVEILKSDSQYSLMLPTTISYIVTYDKDTLIIREKKVFIVHKNNEYRIYRTTNDARKDKDAICIVSGIDDYDKVLDNNMDDIILNVFTFQSIFKKDNNNYYWVSTEKI